MFHRLPVGLMVIIFLFVFFVFLIMIFLKDILKCISHRRTRPLNFLLADFYATHPLEIVDHDYKI